MNYRLLLLALSGVLVLTGCPREQATPADSVISASGSAPAAQEKPARARHRSPADAVPAEGPDMRRIVASAGASVIAAFPAAAGATPPRATRDFNGDGRSDVIWHNVNSGELYYWLMGPNGIVGENGGVQLPIGFTALGTGDFNGDGRADVVSASSSEVRISFASGWTFMPSQVVAARPPGVWALAGITDVNGDGKSDLVWHHRGSGELYYWLMDGNTIFAGQGGAYLPAGSTALAAGDFDGDGRGDILSSTPTEVRISFGPRAGTGWIFSQATLVQARPPAEWRFGGVGDINGDGRTDILWHNTTTREVYSWLMSGTSIAGGAGGTFLSTLGRTIATGDVDGDGRADLVSMGEGDIRIAAARTDGGFTTPKTISRVPFAGWKFVDDVDKPRPAVRGDVDGDGKGDMLFFNTETRELYAWILDGATKSKEQGGTYLPPGFAPLATGDFNGDGRVDVFSTDGAEVRLSLARPDGGFATSVRVADRPVAKWMFGGLGDVDADGRVDVLWFDTEKKEIYAWLMSGPNVVGGKGGNAFLPDADKPLALGDFNGDGMADVLTVDNETSAEYQPIPGSSPPQFRRLPNSLYNVSLSLVTGSFAPSVYVTANTWYPTRGMYDPYSRAYYAGLGDANGDGRDDLFFYSSGFSFDTGTNRTSVQVQLMNGASVTYGGGATLSGGYNVAIEDTNGDGRADILYGCFNAALATSSGTYAGGLPVAASPGAPWVLVEPRLR